MNEKENDFDFEAFKKEAIKALYDRKGLTGKEGAMTPLIKHLLETAMSAELDEHLKETRPKSKNRKNGGTKKRVKSSTEEFKLTTPRDRNGTFEPHILPKNQRRLPGDLEEKILALYARGMSYKDIRSQLEELYGVEISEATISRVTDQVIPQIRDWQSRPVERIYAIIWMDAMHFKVREAGRVISKAIYSVLGVNMRGEKEVLGLYVGDNERASYWLEVLTDLKERGLEDILIASIDNLKGFGDAIESIYPKTDVQLCIVHQIRNTIKFVPWKNQREVLNDLKPIYRASSKELAEHALDEFEAKWGGKYVKAVESWRRNWDRLSSYFKYPAPIRKIIYTTNTVEGYHRAVRRLTKSKGAFTSEQAMMKLVFLATIQFQKRWKNKVRDWPEMLNQFLLYFDDRILDSDTDY
jgi:transposase-like protein